MKPIILDKSDSQFFLYAKGHFKNGENRRERTVSDIRQLIAYRTGCEADQIGDFDIIIVLTHLLGRLGLEKVVAGPKFMSRVIFDGEYGRPVITNTPQKTPLERFIHATLDEISVMQVQDGKTLIIRFADLDPTVFKD